MKAAVDRIREPLIADTGFCYLGYEANNMDGNLYVLTGDFRAYLMSHMIAASSG